jgi:hypothetical protein
MATEVCYVLIYSDYIRGESRSVKAQPLLAIYEWSPLTDNFKYIGRTERVPNETNPVFYKTFWLEKPKTDKKYKVGLFEVEDDKSRELNMTDMIGEVELDLRELLDEPKRRYRLVDASGKELKTCLWVQAKDPAEPGQISRYALSVSARALPDSSSPVNVVLFLKDLNIPKFGPVSQTDALKPMSADTPYRPNSSSGAPGAPGAAGGAPGYIGRLIVDQYSLNDRQVRFGIYDSARFDPSLAWGLGDAEKALIGYAQTTMTKLLELQQSTVDGSVQLPITDSKDVQVGSASLILHAVVVPIPKEKRNAADDGKPKIEIAVSCRELHKKDWQAKSAPLVAIYRKNAEGKYDYLQQTERIRDDRSPSFWRTFLVDRPQAEAEYKVCVIDVDDDSVVVTNPPAPLPAPRGEILAEAVFDASALMDYATHDIRPADEEGLYLDKTMLSLTAKDVGQVKRVEVALNCRALPPSGLSTKLLPDPMVVVYASNAVTRRWSRVPIAQTERLVAMKNPNFKHTVRLDVYSNADRELRVAVYDIEEGQEGSFSESNCIGEAFISLNEFLNARAPMLEYRLMVRGGMDGAQAADGRAVVRLLTEKEPGGPLREFEDESDLILEGDEDDDGDDTNRPKATPAIVVESKVESKDPLPTTPIGATAAASATAPPAGTAPLPETDSKRAGEAPKAADAPVTEAPKAATPAPVTEAPKVEAPKAEATPPPSVPATPVPVPAPVPATVEAPTKAESPKVEAPKAEAPKAASGGDTPKDTPTPRTEAPKAEAPKAEVGKAEAPKAEVPKVEAPKVEATKGETPKDTPRTEQPTVDATKDVEGTKKAADSTPASATPTPRTEAPTAAAAAEHAKTTETPKETPRTEAPKVYRPKSVAKVAAPSEAKKEEKKDVDTKPIKVPVWFRVKDVTKQDWLSPSDPIVRAYVDGQLQGATEWSKNSATYEFKTPIELTLKAASNIRFVVYDVDSSDKPADDKDLVGEVNMTSAQLLSELSSSWPLLRGGKGKGQLTITPLEATIKAEGVRNDRGMLQCFFYTNQYIVRSICCMAMNRSNA